MGEQPLANAYLDSPDDPDPRFPLHARVCDDCLLVQADPVVSPIDLFSEYAFFSSYSKSWVEHCRQFAKEATDRFDLRWDSQVIEVASNDGTLLKEFDVPQTMGVEPAANVADVAREDGVPTVTEFFGEGVARTLPQADLVVANNVLGHVPNLRDFVAGLECVLAPDGVVSIEVPWLKCLIERLEFDTIYHEHFSYWSLTALEAALARQGLKVFDVELLAVHGGSLRVFAARNREEGRRVQVVRVAERDAGLLDPLSVAYTGFAPRVESVCAQINDAVGGLVGGRVFPSGWVEPHLDYTIVGAGAPAKGNTLLNACGLTDRHLAWTTDTSPHKQGKYLPGSHIPIIAPDDEPSVPHLRLVLAWNWLDEVIASFPDYDRKWWVPIPEPHLV